LQDFNNEADSTESSSQPQKVEKEQILFPVSIRKLIVLNCLFFGYYTLFWMFMNWRYLQLQCGRNVHPGWRAILAPIFIWSLYGNMIAIVKENGGKPPAIPSVVLAFIYIIASLAGLMQNPVFLFVALLAVIPMVLIQTRVNEINGGEAAVTNSKFSKVNWIFMVICGLLWLVSILGMLGQLLTGRRV